MEFHDVMFWWNCGCFERLDVCWEYCKVITTGILSYLIDLAQENSILVQNSTSVVQTENNHVEGGLEA